MLSSLLLLWKKCAMEKIRYRLVYNRKDQLNNQGTALVQVEAKLNQRNIYLTTNIYLQPSIGTSPQPK